MKHTENMKPTHGNDFDSSSLPGWASVGVVKS